MLVVALRADVARVDPVLRERRGHLRVLDQELVPVVVEVADDRHVDAEATDLADHLGDRRRGLVAVDGHPDQLRAGMRELGDLDGGRIGVRGVGVRHRLDDDRVGASDQDPAYVYGHGATTDRLAVENPSDVRARSVERIGRRIRRHEPAPPRLRTMSNPVIQMRNANRKTKPTM